MAIDPTTFKPESADDLLSGALEVAIAAAGKSWKEMKSTVEEHLTFIAKTTFTTTRQLEAREITTKQADHTFHLLELNFNSTLLLIEIIPFVVAQAVLNAVFGLLNAVVKNYTGIDFGFGKS
jgi:hypothetical protein